MKYIRKERGHEGKKSRGLTNAKDLPMKIPEERESSYH